MGLLRSSGRFEKALNRKSKSQKRVSSLIQDLKKAKQQHVQNLSDLSTLQAEIEEEIQANRDDLGTINHMLEGVGDLE